MSSIGSLIADLRAAGLQVRMREKPDGDVVVVSPKKRLTPELRERVHEGKDELLDLLRADAALNLLSRLKGYSLPAGRMPVASKMAEALRWSDEPTVVLEMLKVVEQELIAEGGTYDPALAEAVEMVEQTFPGAELVGVKCSK